MKNSLSDLNNYLFEELERLNDDETLVDDNLERELKRSKAITDVSNQIIQNANILLKAKIHSDNFGDNLGNFYQVDNTKKIEKKDPYKEFREKLNAEMEKQKNV